MGFRKLRQSREMYEETDFCCFDGEIKVFKEPDTWTIITAMNRVLSQSRRSSLSDEFWESIQTPQLVASIIAFPPIL